jgi:putative ABC transport system permease protein
VLLFVFGVSMLTAIFFGLIPAAQLSRPKLQSTLKESSRGTMAGSVRHWLRNSLVVAEVALALVLLTGAGLLVRGFINLLRVDPGFAKDRVVALQVFIARNLQQPENMTNFFDQTLERVAAVPGVEAAALVSSPPFINIEQDVPFTIEGQPAPSKGKEPSAYYTEVSADYPRVMSIPLQRGRFFTKFDKTGATPVVVINETMARRYFANEDPVGKKLVVMFDPPEPREIVGVIGDVLHNGLDTAPRPEMFVHYPQSPTPQMTYVVKTTGDPGSMLPAVKGAIREVNRNQTFSKTATMEELVGDSLRQRRFNLFLLGSFAVLALGLAGLGIYGVMSYSTKQRTHEIGVRMALGAQTRDILRLFVGEGLSLALIGVVIGVAGSLLLTQLMKGLLFGVSASDPATFAMIATLLMMVALLACYVPARRASKVDPLVALRYE